jgi:hypothetical protein
MTDSAQDLLAELQALGIEMVASGDRLFWRPRDAVSPTMRKMIKKHKAALIALLSGLTGLINPAPDRGGSLTPSIEIDSPDTRPVWILHPSGYPEKVFTPDRIPPEATYWCREGDLAWRPLQQCEKGPRLGAAD